MHADPQQPVPADSITWELLEAAGAKVLPASASSVPASQLATAKLEAAEATSALVAAGVFEFAYGAGEGEPRLV